MEDISRLRQTLLSKLNFYIMSGIGAGFSSTWVKLEARSLDIIYIDPTLWCTSLVWLPSSLIIGS